MRPLRFAIFVACASAICIALGRLWVQSLDQGSAGPVARVLHAGTGAVGVAIAGVDRQLRAHRLSTPRRRQIIDAAAIVARPGSQSALSADRAARGVGVAVAQRVQTVHHSAPKPRRARAAVDPGARPEAGAEADPEAVAKAEAEAEART